MRWPLLRIFHKEKSWYTTVLCGGLYYEYFIRRNLVHKVTGKTRTFLCRGQAFTSKPAQYKSHVRRFSLNWVGRGSLAAVTGSTWLLQGLCPVLFFGEYRLMWLVWDRFMRGFHCGINQLQFDFGITYIFLAPSPRYLGHCMQWFNIENFLTLKSIIKYQHKNTYVGQCELFIQVRNVPSLTLKHNYWLHLEWIVSIVQCKCNVISVENEMNRI